MNLKEKAIKIQGKDYVLVSDRVIYFNEIFKNWSIKTEIVELTEKMVVIKATITPDVAHTERIFTWYSQEINDGKNFINRTSMIENAETSAVGRALGMMWIGVIDSIASLDEINKAKNRSTVKITKTDFTADLFQKFKAKSDNYKNADEAIKKLEENYFLSDEAKKQINDLYDFPAEFNK